MTRSPAAMAAVYNMGKESGLWDTTMRTDTELLTKKEPWRSEREEPRLLRPDRICEHYGRVGHG